MAKYEVYGNIGVILTYDSESKTVTSIMADLDAWMPLRPVADGDPLVMRNDGDDWVTVSGPGTWDVCLPASDADWPDVSTWTQLQEYAKATK